jgi:hypothetical protein
MQMMMWALIVLVAEAAAPAGQTTPLDRGWVSARAEWVVHVDAEAWNASTIGRFIMDHAEEFDLDLDELEDFEEETGLDPLTDLLGVTAYGWGSGDTEQVVVVAVTTAKAARGAHGARRRRPRAPAIRQAARPTARGRQRARRDARARAGGDGRA